MVLIAIVALVVANALSIGIKGSLVTDNRKEALDQARVAMERMTREIRNVRSSADISSTLSSTQFCFKNTDAAIVSFRYSANTIVRQEGLALLTDCPGSGGNTLANNITSFSFSYLQSDGTTDPAPPANTKRIRITTASTLSGESVTLQSEVYPRYNLL